VNYPFNQILSASINLLIVNAFDLFLSVYKLIFPNNFGTNIIASSGGIASQCFSFAVALDESIIE